MHFSENENGWRRAESSDLLNRSAFIVALLSCEACRQMYKRTPISQALAQALKSGGIACSLVQKSGRPT